MSESRDEREGTPKNGVAMPVSDSTKLSAEGVINLARMMPKEAYEVTKSAVELGRWPDGTQLSDVQREMAMSVVLIWEDANLPNNTDSESDSGGQGGG